MESVACSGLLRGCGRGFDSSPYESITCTGPSKCEYPPIAFVGRSASAPFWERPSITTRRAETKHSGTSGGFAPESCADCALIQRLLGGEAAAWEAFVDRYAGLVRRRVRDVAEAFGRSGDWSTVDDVTAEVFASLLARDAAALRAFRGQSSLSTYLAVIATRIARRMIARVLRGAHTQTGSFEEIEPAQLRADPQSLLIGREEKEELLALVDRLPERQRELIVAFYREEQTYAEISTRFDIPIGSIGTTLRRAESKLRQWINDETK